MMPRLFTHGSVLPILSASCLAQSSELSQSCLQLIITLKEGWCGWGWWGVRYRQTQPGWLFLSINILKATIVHFSRDFIRHPQRLNRQSEGKGEKGGTRVGGSGGAGKVGDREKVMILTKTRGRNGRRRERETAEGEKGQREATWRAEQEMALTIHLSFKTNK